MINLSELLIEQESWLLPMLNVLIGLACIKYLVLDWKFKVKVG